MATIGAAAAGGVFRHPAEGAKLVEATNHFAWDLYTALREDREAKNLFLSPASLSVALGMTYLGAGGVTAKQMADALHLADVTSSNVHTSFGDLQVALNSPADDYVMRVANRLYGQKGFAFLPTFVEATKLHYAAELKEVDFGREAETRKEINNWVEAKTNKKIQDLIPSGILNALVRLVLVNAIYFKGDWAHQFDKANTKDGDFFIDASTTVKVPMMHQKRKFMFGHNSELKARALELPYKGKKLSMLILLPEDKFGLPELERKLSPKHLHKLEDTFQMREIDTRVSLPKFRLDDSFSLGDTLAGLGMGDLFSQTAADLSGITGGRDLFVSKVVHKAFINVDEEGSEAAAATGVVMMLRCLPLVMDFVADHPFLFMIRSNETRSILFLGRVMQPPSADAAANSDGKSEL